MFNRLLALAFAACITAPALAQTTTVTSQSQPPPPPPPSSTTTVTTQPPPPPPTQTQPSTQVVVNPNDPQAPASTTTTRTRAPSEVTTVETHHEGPAPLVIVATDALYGGIAGLLVGGGITLIDQGNNWQRNLSVGAGIGVLAGAGFGIYDAVTRNETTTTTQRAEADRNPAASNHASALAMGGRF